MPLVRVDLVLLSVREQELTVLLGQRREPPYAGAWGLPGGVLRIDLDESLEAAARRVAGERLGVALPNLEQVMAVGGAARDPRAPWAMTVVYRAVVTPEFEATPGKRIDAFQWLPVGDQAGNHIGQDNLAFDHGELIARAIAALRSDVERLSYPRGWLPEPFTISELQAWTEAVMGHAIDKVTFRRRLDAGQILEPVPGVMRTGAHRPAQVFTLQ
jgi:8-oxo-dGTP diphosphatase